MKDNVTNAELGAANTPFPIVQGEFYELTVEDDGTNIQVLMNNELVLSHTTVDDHGDRIHLNNRERYVGDFGVEFDWIDIVGEEEPILDLVDIRANGSDELVVLGQGEWLTITADLAADPAITGDTWILALTSQNFPFNLFSYNLDRGSWIPWLFTLNGPSAQGAIPDMQSEIVLQANGLPGGFYTFYLGYDVTQNRQIDFDGLELDAVPVFIEN